jgi:tRNA threonylcarbamoyladenosine modification (KEOPS) complex  Pcc1 subunit
MNKKLNRHINLSITFSSKEQAQIISKSLEPEIQKDIPNVKIDLKQKNAEIVLSFSALYTNVLRAAINSYIRWIETAYKVNSINLN